MENVQQLLDALADLRKKANANAVLSKPIETEGRTVIPVAEVSYDFGVEIGQEAAGESPSGSGGLRVHPVAVIEVTPEATLVRPVLDEQRLALAGALLIGWAILCAAWALVKIFARSR